MKVLFAGLGSIGQRHLRNLLELTKGDVEVSAWRQMRSAPVLDEQLNVISSTDPATYYGVRVYDHLDEALAAKPDVVFVTNPTRFHVSVAIKAAAAGCHIFIEKPVADAWDGIDELQHLVRQNNLVAVVGYHYRFHPGLQTVKQWLDEGRFGRLVSAQFFNGEYIPHWHPYEDYRQTYGARRDLGGGALVTQSHEFDTALWLLGRPSQIFAVGGQLSSLELDVEDSVSVLMKFERDGRPIPVSVNLDYLQSPPVRRAVLVGDAGKVTWDDREKIVRLELVDGTPAVEYCFADLDRNSLFLNELRHFVDCVSGKSTPVVDLETGCQSLALALTARHSMERGEALDTFDQESLRKVG